MVKGKWKRKIYFSGGKLLSAVSRLIPKDSKRVCFFCKSGLDDNSEALFRYMMEQGYAEQFRIDCVVDDPAQYQQQKNPHVYMMTIKKSLWSLLRSKYLFCHGEMVAIMPARQQISVNYWHGTPLKKINGMMDKLGDYRYDFFTYITAAAPAFRKIFAEAFGCREDQVLINGHPRNDYLFRDSDALAKFGVSREDYRKIFLWMPTYRKSRDGFIRDGEKFSDQTGDIPLMEKKEDLRELEQFLGKQKSYLFLKMHPAQDLSKLDPDLRNFEHICFLTNEDMRRYRVPLYSLVREADALITDYSSIYFDYLLLDRPVGFILADLDSYEEHRGFVVPNPLDYMPGPKIYKREELFSFLEDVLEERDDYQEERAQINSKVNYYQDGENCERLLKMIHLEKG